MGTDYRLTARNAATASENRIHADDVARRHGFKGGLVPGTTVYGYACHALLQTLGRAWVAGGTTGIRFLVPCYDGEELLVSVASNGSFVVTVGERECAVGSAGVAADPPAAADVEEIPPAPAPAPEDRPLASERTLVAGEVLGCVGWPVDEATATAYLSRIGEPATLYAAEGLVHPGLLLEGANRVLMANVVLPAWLHVESDVRHWRPVSVGEQVEVRAVVAAQFERKGHRFVTLNVVWVAGHEAVVTARHTAIWQLAGSQSLEMG